MLSSRISHGAWMNPPFGAVLQFLMPVLVCTPCACRNRPSNKTHEVDAARPVDASLPRFSRLRRLDLRCQSVDLGDLIEVYWASYHGDSLHVSRAGCIEGNITAEERVQDGCANATSIRDFITELRRVAPIPQQESSEPLPEQRRQSQWEFVRWTTSHGTYTWQIPNNNDGQWEHQTHPTHLRIAAARRRLLTANTPHAAYARRTIEARPAIASASIRWSGRSDIGGGYGIHLWHNRRMVLRADGIFLESSSGSHDLGEDFAGQVDPVSARRFVEFLRAHRWDDVQIESGDFEGANTANAGHAAALWLQIKPVERCRLIR